MTSKQRDLSNHDPALGQTDVDVQDNHLARCDGCTAPAEHPYPATPELDKQNAIIRSGKAATVQDFIDWLYEERHLTLCEPKPDSLHGYYVPASTGGPEQLMADFFGIDRDRIETERRAVLDAYRSQNG